MMTAMYGALYVYVGRESLLKYFEQIFYHDVLCKRGQSPEAPLYLWFVQDTVLKEGRWVGITLGCR